MFWTILGLGITTIVSVEGAVNSDRPRWMRLALIGLAVLGFSVAIVSAAQENTEHQLAERRAKENGEKLDAAKAELRAQSDLLTLVNVTVGDLASLNRLSGGARYFVRIATDTSRERLEAYLRAIDAKFKGASASGLVTIRPPGPHSSNYKLVFGSGLDVTAAEVFQRLANAHHFPPPSQIAEIEPEPGP